MSSRNNFILGGGISGLLYSYFNPQFRVITDVVGGQMNSSFSLGPRLLHSTELTREFLDELNLLNVFPEKKIKVGFFYDNRLHETIDEENRKKYFEKTRGISSVYDSSMSGGKNEFKAFVIDEKILIGRLITDRIIFDKIKSIDLKNKILVGKEKYHFSKIVSTIPRPLFCMLAGDKPEAKKFRYITTSFVKRNELPASFDKDEFMKFDYVYFPGNEYDFHRITVLSDGFCFEYKNMPNFFIPESEKFAFLPYGQLIEKEDKKEYKNVEFFGRFAEWRHSIRMDTEIGILKTPF
jgi:hypothetical protein